jgi:hypothetical protein
VSEILYDDICRENLIPEGALDDMQQLWFAYAGIRQVSNVAMELHCA